MDKGIDANASLDYIEFQIFPGQNRYDACICLSTKKETVTSGLLTLLLRHSERVKALHSDDSVASIKLERLVNHGNSKWFTKSTLLRFLHIISSSNVLTTAHAIANEISQLEEARRFHISLYTKGPDPNCHNGETESSYSNGASSTPEVETDPVSSDASKNELVRAMDLRLTALREELVAAVDKAAGTSCSVEEIADLEKFSHYFGATELRKTLCKFIEMYHGKQIVDIPSHEQSPAENGFGYHSAGSVGVDYRISKPSQSETPVKYGVSPAKAAHAERHGSSESEESSYLSEEDRPSVERSRTLIRCASPRRSASPMRRVQIGRTGSRRSTPLTIKSLTHFPVRERVVSHREAAPNSSDEEGSEGQYRKADDNIKRMSVQDAVKLFESKQKEETCNIQKTKSLLSASIGGDKSVVRRWSAGMGESPDHPSDSAHNKSEHTGPSTLGSAEREMNSSEANPESNSTYRDCLAEASEVNFESNTTRGRVSCPDNIQGGAQPPSTEDTSEKLTSSAEWSRQKEAELNQLLMKMMETKPAKYQRTVTESTKRKIALSEQRGGHYDHYKEKRDMKLQGETAGKRVEKEKYSRATQKTLDERKAAMGSKISSGIGGCENAKKPQKSFRNGSQSAKPKMETSKSAIVKKGSQKTSPLPATRKSWPSAPSFKGTVASPAPTPGGMTSAGSTTARRRSQPTPLAPRSNPKVEGSQQRPKPVKASQGADKKSSRDLSEKKQQAVTKTGRTAKTTKSQIGSADPASSVKPSLYSKMTKKSSVVPLESKSFLKKGTGIGSGVSPTMKPKSSPQPEGCVRKSGDLIQAKENNIIPICPNSAIEHPEGHVEGLKGNMDTGSEIVESLQVFEEPEILDQVVLCNDGSSQKIEGSPLKSEAEEVISPAAWVEIEEQEQHPVSCNDGVSQVESPTNSVQVKMPSLRVRHSLSQMLLEENSEPDVVEWGNAENPPSMIYQKDAPKGLKRLLKFARKSKTDANSTGWSSPSVYSEGEDDAEDSKAVHKKSTENLLKKATLRSFESYEENTTTSEPTAQANTSRSSAQTLSQRLREGQASASMASTKTSRSFFSLSAFRGGK